MPTVEVLKMDICLIAISMKFFFRVALLFISTSLSSCLIYPRLGHIYTTPELKILVVDASLRPLPSAQVVAPISYKKSISGITGADGIAYLPAHRKFCVFEMIVMDMYPSGFSPKAIFQNDSALGHRQNYFRTKGKIAVTDTIRLGTH